MKISEIISPEEKKYLLELRVSCPYFSRGEVSFLASHLGSRTRCCCHGHHEGQVLPLDDLLGHCQVSPIFIRNRRGFNVIL